VRGGYQYCNYKNVDIPETNICDKTKTPFKNDTEGYICSGNWVDQFNSIKNFCKNDPVCGDDDIDVNTNTHMFNASFSGLVYGHSCVYRARTICGLVRANLTFAPTVSPGDYDIAYGYSDLPRDKDLDATLNNVTFISDEYSKNIRGDELNGGYL